jgi:hypothetical protein
MRYDRWETPGSQRIVIGKVDLLGVEYRCSNYIVFAWGLKRELQQDMCEITEIELRANFSLLLCAPEGRSRSALQKRYNPPKPTPVVEDVTVDSRELFVTAPVAPENIDVTPVARKASARKRQSKSHEASREQLELVHKIFTDDEDESKAYYVAEVRYFPDFNQVCCFCVPHTDKNLQLAKDLASSAKYLNVYQDDHIFDCDYVSQRVTVYGQSMKSRKTKTKSSLSHIEILSSDEKDEYQRQLSTYINAATVFEEEVELLHRQQCAHPPTSV